MRRVQHCFGLLSTRSSSTLVGVGLALVALMGIGCNGSASGGGEAPTIESIDVDPAPVAPGKTATLSVSANDPDTDDRIGTPPDADSTDAGASSGMSAMLVEWSLTDEAEEAGWSVESTGREVTLTAADAYQKEAELTVTVTDGSGLEATETRTVSTGQNETPRLADLEASPNPVEPGGTITLTASGEDPRGDELAYEWRTSGDWSLGSETGSTVDVTAPDEAGVSSRIDLTVADGFGLSTSTSLQVETRRNNPPSINSMTANPPQVAPGETTTISVSASDPDGDELSYSWNVGGDWSVDGTGNEVTLTAPDAYDVSGSVAVTVEDSRGVTTTGQVVVSTESNQGPVLSTLTADPQSVQKGGEIDLMVEADDPEESALTYSWDVSSQDWTLSTQNKTATLSAPGEPGVSATVSVDVTDAAGETARSSIVVSTQPNQPPSISSVTANPTEVTPGGTADLQAAATDPDGDELSYNWSPPSGWSVSSQSASSELTAPSTYGVTGVVNLTVSDGFGGTASGLVVVSTESNQPPIITSMSASPPRAEPGGTTTVTVGAVDTNSNQTLSYSWTVPSGWSGSSTGQSITLTAPTQYDAADPLTVEVSDGVDPVTQTLTVRTVENEDPQVASVSASPNPVLENGTMDLTASASDPYGDSLDYTWSVNDASWTLSGSGSSVDLSAPNSAGSSATVTLDVTDGNGGSATATKNVSTEGCSKSDFGNCDGSISNGCETDLTSSDSHCGACGNSCGSNSYCSYSTCRDAPTYSTVQSAGNTQDGWMSSNPYGDMHDGGMVYSPSRDGMYALYGNDNSGRNVYFIDHTSQTATQVATLQYGRHGSHPVLDEDGGWVYFPPSQNTSQLERIEVGGTHTRQTLSAAPAQGTFSRGAFKDGKLWVLLDDGGLYAYDPSSDSWTQQDSFGNNGMVVAHGTSARNVVYVWVENDSTLYEYDISSGTTSSLANFPGGTGLGGNGQMEFIPSASGASNGFIYAVNGCSGTPYLYRISNDSWNSLANPQNNGGCSGLSAYDSSRSRLYVTGSSDNIYYYDY